MIALFSEEHAREMKRINQEKEALKKGLEKKAQEISQKLYQSGTSIEDISKLVDYSVYTVKEWLGLRPS